MNPVLFRPFSSLPRELQAGPYAWMTAVFFVFLALTISAAIRTRKIRYLLLPFGGLASSLWFLCVWGIADSLSGKGLPLRTAILPSWIGLLLTVLLLAGAVFSETKLRQHLARSVTGASVRESVDNLPTGLCFATLDGLPLMVNRRMETLCQAVTGDGLLNANRFWNALKERSMTDDVPDVETEDAAAVRTGDGRIWIFTRESIRVEGMPVEQFMASDATDLYALGQRLEEDNRALRDMNRRLSEYGENMTELTRDEEILEAKVWIHDSLGQVLLASKIALAGGVDDAAIGGIFDAWRDSVSLLRHGTPPAESEGSDPVRQIEEAAESVGVRVIFDGPFPRDDRSAGRLLFAASREALTNAVRHAGASEMRIAIRETASFWEAVFTNDGMPPAGEIAEGGGLTGLRKRVEDAGGVMTTAVRPAFMLTLRLPKFGFGAGAKTERK